MRGPPQESPRSTAACRPPGGRLAVPGGVHLPCLIRSCGTSGCRPSSTGRQSRVSPWSESEACPGCCPPSASTASPGPAGSAPSSSGPSRLPPRGHKTASTLPVGCALSLRWTRDPPIIECIEWVGCGYGELRTNLLRIGGTDDAGRPPPAGDSCPFQTPPTSERVMGRLGSVFGSPLVRSLPSRLMDCHPPGRKTNALIRIARMDQSRGRGAGAGPRCPGQVPVWRRRRDLNPRAQRHHRFRVERPRPSWATPVQSINNTCA